MRRIVEIALLMLLIATGVARAQAVPVPPAMTLPGGTGGGGGGSVNSVGGTAPITIGGTASNPVVSIVTPLVTSLGGTGLVSPTAHTIPIMEGSGPFSLLSCPSAGLVLGQGAGADPICAIMSGDCSLSSTAAITCTKTNGISFSGLATASIPLSISNGGTGSTSAGDVAGNGISVTGTFPNQTISLSPPVAVGNGGTGTATPSLIAGTNITITGAWPNQTINSTGGGGTSPGGSNGAIQYNGSGSFNGVVITGLVQGNGTSAPTALTGLNATMLLGQGAGIEPTFNPASGDCSITAGGAFTCTRTNGALFGPAIVEHTLTESAGAATMVAASASVPSQDDETIALNANLTLTTPAAASMTTGERVTVHATTSGTAWTVTFAAGAGVTLKDSVLGGSNSAVGQACAVPATGWINYAFRWDGTNFELLYCGPQPGPTAIVTSVGGTGATSISAWPINIPHTQTISGATNETLQTAWVTTEVFTFSASATVTLPQSAWAGQALNAMVCNNGTGGFTPSFAAAGGLTIIGTFPVFTTTASKCGDFSMTYVNTTTAYITGSAAGPL